MYEQLAAAGNGSPIVLAGERALHSRYNPLGEAERYINTLNIPEEVRFFILIEPGLGYVIPVIQKKFPLAKIVVLHVSDFFTGPQVPKFLSGDRAAWPVWSPRGGIGVQAFLEQEVPDVPAAQVRILEWRPALTIYGEACLNLLRECAEFVKRADANARTVRGFGRRWFKNCLRNLGIINRVPLWPQDAAAGSLPWIITGAGPSLEEALPRIRALEETQGAHILAASSSMPALAAAQLAPDMVISTDGGGWALLHLYEALRHAGKPPPALAVSLWAALPSQCGDLPILLLSDGSLWQRLLLEGAGLRQVSSEASGGTYAVFPQRGTVTASALDLALALTGGPVFFAGMDLGHRDIMTHARPYGLDRLQEERACRFLPRYSQAFVRSRLITAAGSHSIYAAWFKQQLGAYPDRLFSLGDNNPVFSKLRTAQASIANPKGGPVRIRNVGEHPAYTLEKQGRELRRRAVHALLSALKQPEFAAALQGELGPLLLPEEERPAPASLEAEIQTLAFSAGEAHG